MAETDDLTTDQGERNNAGAAPTGQDGPRVSVVIPCHNYEQYLGPAIESALSQEGVSVDVVVVDDASTDGSRAIAQEWVGKDSRVRLLVHEQNKGHIITFNEALEAATGTYVVKLDADDIITPGSLKRSTDLMEAHPEVVLVYGRAIHVRGEMPTDLPTRVTSWKIWPGEKWLGIMARRVHNPISQPEIMMRRTALETVGGHRAEVPASSDFNLWLRMASIGSVARVNGPIQGLYRVHDKSMRATIHSGLLLDFESRRDAFDVFLQESAANLSDPEGLTRVIHRSLARDAVNAAFQDFQSGIDPQPLLQEAVALDPTVQRTLAWKSLQAQMKAGSPTWWGLPGRIKRDIAGRIRYRVKHKFGV